METSFAIRLCTFYKKQNQGYAGKSDESDLALAFIWTGPSAEELAILDLQRLMVRIETELSDMRQAAWRQHEAQPQINKLRARRGAVRAAVSVAVSNLHFKASESVVAAHFSVIGPVVRVTIPFKQKGAFARCRVSLQSSHGTHDSSIEGHH